MIISFDRLTRFKYTEDKYLKNTTGDFKKPSDEKEVKELLSLSTQAFNVNNGTNGNGIQLDRIIKSISSDGKMIYKDKNGNILNDEEVLKIRESYKKFILENGGLHCAIMADGFQDANISDDGIYEGTPTSGRKVCYYTGVKPSNHAVLIIGWDDNFSRNNFPEDNRPQKDGAYIVLNSWGSEWGENGVFYLSYEDIYCESRLAGLTQVSEYEDTVKPEINFELNNEKVKIKCTDEYGSGIDESSLKYMWLDHNLKPDVGDKGWKGFVNNSEITYEESKYLWVVAKDKAGNQNLINNRHNGSKEFLSIDREYIDKNRNPIWTKSATLEITHNDLVEFELSVWSDTISDEELKKMLTAVDSGGIYQYILKVNKNGIHTINYAIKNKKDGYEEIGESITVKIDKTAPTSPSITLSGIGKGNEYKKGATVTIKPGTDSGSGVSKTEIEILDENGKNIEVDNKFKFKLDKIGQYTIKATTYDMAGNKSNETKLTVKIIDYILAINGKSDNTVNVVDGEDAIAKITCSNSTTGISKYKVKVYCKDSSLDLEDTQEISTKDATTNEITIPSTYLWGDTIKVTGYAIDSNGKEIGTTSTINIKLNTPVTLGKIGNQTVEEGQNVTFKVVKEKDGKPAEYTYQWYVNTKESTTGGTKIAGAQSASYTVKATSDLNGKYFYCVVTNGACTTKTNAAKLTVKVAEYTLTINGKSDDTVDVMHGQDVTAKIVCSNSSANVSKYRFEVHYEDEEDTQVFSSEGNEKVIKSGYFYGGTTSVIGYALDSTNKVIGTTKSIKINLNTAVTLGKIGDQTVEEGKNVTFKVVKEKDGEPAEYTYQWYKNNRNSTTGGTKITGAESASYTVKATSDLNGKYFYCVVKNGICTTTTNAAKLTVKVAEYTLTINGKSDDKVDVMHGQDVTAKIVCSNSSANVSKYRFEVHYEDEEDTQVFSSEGNEKVIKSGYFYGGTTSVIGYALDSTNKVIGTTKSIKINLNTAVTLGKIGDQTVEEGKNVTFKVVKEKDGEPAEYTYQWYKNNRNSTTGGTKITGAESASYTVKATSDLNGKYFYCVVKNGICTTTTNAAKLTVKIDTEGPTITRAVLSNNNWTKSNKTITVTATDNQTGVKGYGISNSKSKAPETWSESNIIEVTQNGTYYVWAKDGKGNTSCFGTAIQSKIDKNKPKIGQITVSNYVITVSGITDSESGIAKISISSTSGKYDWKSNTNNTYTTGKLTPGTYYIAVMDNAGNIVEQSKVVNKENILVKNIKLSQKDLTLNNAVKSTKLIATIEPEDATEKGLKWKSSNEKVAKVDQNGVVTAVANGTAQITVEATDRSGVSTTITCKVIEHTNPTGIEIQGKNRVRKDEKYTYTVKYTPEDANINKDVKWTVNDEEIATINSETGEVEGKKAGKVKITASLKKIENVVATKEIEVYYENPTTAEPSATVTTNSIEVENRQTNEYAEIVKVEYGISENGKDWRWQESNKFEGLTEDKEYKIKTRATDENGATSESEILEVKTNKLELGKLLLKKNNSDGYEEGTWTNSNVSYELVDEKNLTTVKILNENNEVVDIENNEIKDNGVYTILVETTDGTNKKSKEYKVKIDKGTAELIINKDSEEEVELVKLKVKLEGSISGIKSLKINGVNIEYNNEEIIYEVTENGTYKFEVEDNAGNIIERSIEVSNIKNKDTEVPKDDDNKTDTKPSDNVESKDNQSGLEQTEDKDTSDRILPQTGEKIIICIAISIGIIVYAIRTYIKIKRIY